MSRVVGARNMHLAYVACPTDNVDYDAPFELTSDTWCLEDAGSLEKELIKRAHHSNPLLKEDNAAIYFRLEESTRLTAQLASIKPFQRKKDNRNAYMSIVE